MMSEKCMLDTKHYGAMLIMARRHDSDGVFYLEKDNVITGMSVWLAFDACMRYARMTVHYNEQTDDIIEILDLAPFGFNHKSDENELPADAITAYFARNEKDDVEGDIIANIPDLEKGHENPYVIELMREAFDYYTAAKRHMENRSKQDAQHKI